jgi:hypothetical protein
MLLAADAPLAAEASWAGLAPGVPLRRAQDASALGALLGRGPVAVVVVTVEGLAGALLEAIDRWWAFGAISCDNNKLQPKIERAQGEAAPWREEAEAR